MTFFRSEEHLRNWAQFNESAAGGIISLPDLMQLFSCQLFRKRLDPEYFMHQNEYEKEIFSVLKKIGKTDPFWSIPGV